MKKFFALFTVIALLAVTGSAFAANSIVVKADPSYLSIKLGETTSLKSTVSATAANSGKLGDFTVTGGNATISGKEVTITAPTEAGTYKVTVSVTETYYASDDVGHTNPLTATGSVTISVNVYETGSEETGGTVTVSETKLASLTTKLGDKYKGMKVLSSDVFTESSFTTFDEVEDAFEEGYTPGEGEKVTPLMAVPSMKGLTNGIYIVGLVLPKKTVEKLGDGDDRKITFPMVFKSNGDSPYFATVKLMTEENGIIETNKDIVDVVKAAYALFMIITIEDGVVVNSSVGDVYASAVDIVDPVIGMAEAPVYGALALTASQATVGIQVGHTTSAITLSAENVIGKATYDFAAVDADDESADDVVGAKIVPSSDTTSATVTFTPTAVGTYNVVFTVTDDGRETENVQTTTVTLDVTSGPYPDGPGGSSGGCSAGFSALALAVLGGFIATRRK